MPKVFLEFPGFGLSNRIRTLLAFHEIARRKSAELIINWNPNHMCPGEFLDSFENLPDTKFVSGSEFKRLRKGSPKSLYFKGQATLESLLRRHGISSDKKTIKRLYSLLKPVAELQEDIKKTISDNGLDKAIGLHIRRTDHVSFIKRMKGTYSDDSYFEKVIRKYPKTQKFYLSTDNAETQKKFQNKFPGQMIVFAEVPKTKQVRKTSTDHAVTDLYLLGSCRQMYGSMGSSFSEFAKRLNGTPGTIGTKSPVSKPKPEPEAEQKSQKQPTHKCSQCGKK